MSDLIPPRRNEFLTKDGLPTQRFADYLEAIASKTNSNTAATSINADGSAARAQLLALQQQVGSGDFLTWDEDGFTWDSDKFTFDQDEA